MKVTINIKCRGVASGGGSRGKAAPVSTFHGHLFRKIIIQQKQYNKPGWICIHNGVVNTSRYTNSKNTVSAPGDVLHYFNNLDCSTETTIHMRHLVSIPLFSNLLIESSLQRNNMRLLRKQLVHYVAFGVSVQSRDENGNTSRLAYRLLNGPTWKWHPIDAHYDMARACVSLPTRCAVAVLRNADRKWSFSCQRVMECEFDYNPDLN